MATIMVRDAKSLSDAVDSGHSSIEIVGEKFSQQITKAMNAYHKYNSSRNTRNLASGGALLGLALGPVGWAYTAGAVGTMLFTKKSADDAVKAFKTLPFCDLAAKIAQANYTVSANNGTTVVITR